MYNLHYWIRCSQTTFRKQIAVLREVIENRLLPSFATIEKEAEAISEETWKRLDAAAGPDSDPGIAAETAEDAGVSHYLAMYDCQQGLLNLSCVALYHMIEQQQLTVLRQELIPHDEVITFQLLKVEEFIKRLADVDIKVKAFGSWGEIEELRHLANAVKHAEGKSAESLRNLRPEIFTPHCFRGDAQPFFKGPNRWFFQPLTGQDIYVTTGDFQRYFDAADTFWREFADALAVKAQQGNAS
jgi:hypothetical protein